MSNNRIKVLNALGVVGSGARCTELAKLANSLDRGQFRQLLTVAKLQLGPDHTVLKDADGAFDDVRGAGRQQAGEGPEEPAAEEETVHVLHVEMPQALGLLAGLALIGIGMMATASED